MRSAISSSHRNAIVLTPKPLALRRICRDIANLVVLKKERDQSVQFDVKVNKIGHSRESRQRGDARSRRWQFPQTPIAWWSTLIVLCSVLLLPLLVVDVPPLLDYPNHLARVYALTWGQQNAVLSAMYAPHWAIIPNLAVDLVLPPLLWILPVHVAGRILLAMTLFLPVVGTVLYSTVTFGRRSYWSIAVCLVASNGLFLLGFINFQLGIGLALVCAATWMACRETHATLTAAIGAICAVLLFFSHLMGLAFFFILLGSYEAERSWIAYRRGGSLLAAIGRCGMLLLPAVTISLALYTASEFARVSNVIVWETVHDKLIRAAMSLINYNLPLDMLSAGLLAAFLLTCAARRLIRMPLRSAISLGVVGALYVAAPLGFKGTGYIDARFAVMFGFLVFAGIRPTRLAPRTALLVGFAVVGLFGIRTSEVAAIWYAHNHDLTELRDVISVVEPGSRVLVATVDDSEVAPAERDFLRRQYLSDGTRLDAHTAALLLIERDAFWTFLFANPDQQPIELRSPFREIAARTIGMPTIRLLSASAPIPADLPGFPMEGQWSCCYDYVLLLEAGARPEFSNGNLQLLRKSDYADLFRISRSLPNAARAVGRRADLAQ